MTDPVTRVGRRTFLKAGLAASVAGLAGCASSDEDDAESPTADGIAAFSGIDVADGDLIVELADESVTGVNLIGPDGTLFGQQSVASGVSTVRFQLIELELSQSSHYTPGEYELVAERGEESASQPLELRPDLRVREIEQYRDDDDPSAPARLAAVVENNGNAPTWIHDQVYRDAPYWAANDELGTNPRIPYLHKPEELDDLILRPGDERTYVGSSEPLRFVDEDVDAADCSLSTEMTVVLGTAVEEPLEKQIRITAGGDPAPLGVRDGYICSDVSVEMLESVSDPADDSV
jgi:hypothetical protein